MVIELIYSFWGVYCLDVFLFNSVNFTVGQEDMICFLTYAYENSAGEFSYFYGYPVMKHYISGISPFFIFCCFENCNFSL